MGKKEIEQGAGRGTRQETHRLITVRVEERWLPPDWAILQRKLFDRLNQAALEFTARYTRADGTLIWREEWPGMDVEARHSQWTGDVSRKFTAPACRVRCAVSA